MVTISTAATSAPLVTPTAYAKSVAVAYEFPSPELELELLGVSDTDWKVLIAEKRSREATAPDGAAGTVAWVSDARNLRSDDPGGYQYQCR